MRVGTAAGGRKWVFEEVFFETLRIYMRHNYKSIENSSMHRERFVLVFYAAV